MLSPQQNCCVRSNYYNFIILQRGTPTSNIHLATSQKSPDNRPIACFKFNKTDQCQNVAETLLGSFEETKDDAIHNEPRYQSALTRIIHITTFCPKSFSLIIVLVSGVIYVNVCRNPSTLQQKTRSSSGINFKWQFLSKKLIL